MSGIEDPHGRIQASLDAAGRLTETARSRVEWRRERQQAQGRIWELEDRVELPEAVTAEEQFVELREEEELTEANKLLRAIPDSIGDASVEKHEVPGAKFVIVHIGDVHNRGPRGTNKKTEAQIAKTSAEVRKILEELTKRLSTNKVYLEGMTPSALKDYEKDLLGIRTSRKLLASLQEDLVPLDGKVKESEEKFGKDAPETKRLRKGVGEIRRFVKLAEQALAEELEDFRHDNRGAADLVLEGKVTIDVAETDEANDAAARVKIPEGVHPFKDPAVRKKLFDDREQVFIDIAHKKPGTGKIVIYGNKHNFLKMIQLHNEKHPSAKISYVKITPKGAREFGQYLEELEEDFRFRHVGDPRIPEKIERADVERHLQYLKDFLVEGKDVAGVTYVIPAFRKAAAAAKNAGVKVDALEKEAEKLYKKVARLSAERSMKKFRSYAEGESNPRYVSTAAFEVEKDLWFARKEGVDVSDLKRDWPPLKKRGFERSALRQVRAFGVVVGKSTASKFFIDEARDTVELVVEAKNLSYDVAEAEKLLKTHMRAAVTIALSDIEKVAKEKDDEAGYDLKLLDPMGVLRMAHQLGMPLEDVKGKLEGLKKKLPAKLLEIEERRPSILDE